MIEYILTGLYVLSCLVLILFVLLQPGKADAAAIFGGGATSTAFGPRGAQTILAKITIGAATVFFLTAFLFSIPGLFGKKSVTRGLQTAPVQTPPPATNPSPAQAPATEQKKDQNKQGEDKSPQAPAPKKQEPKNK